MPILKKVFENDSAGIKVNKVSVVIFRYAGDTVILVKTLDQQRDIQRIIYKSVQYNEERGVKLNAKKNKVCEYIEEGPKDQ